MNPAMITTSDDVALHGQWTGAARPDQPTVVVCHPHPMGGGSMHTPVVQELWQQAEAVGLNALRFDFRGVGRSEGTHDEGNAEQLDVAAAVALGAEQGDGTVILAGWSFGADLALTCTDPCLAGWFAVAPPLRVVPTEQLIAAHDDRPKLLMVPEHDQFNPPEQAEATVAGWTATTMQILPGGDHFFSSGTSALVEPFTGFLAELT